MERKKQGILYWVRYFIYFIALLSIFLVGNLTFEKAQLLTVYFLLYLINAHIRIYFLRDHPFAIMACLGLELFFISQLHTHFGGFVFIYSFVAILDAALLLPKYHAYSMLLLTYTFIMMQSMRPLYYDLSRYPELNILFNTVLAIGFGGLGRYIYEQERKTKEAHILYDELRRSEEKLQEMVAAGVGEKGEAPAGLEREYKLTAREMDILKGIGEGLTNKEIAGRLFLSEGTVKNHITEILSKLRLRDRAQIAIFAVKKHIVD